MRIAAQSDLLISRPFYLAVFRHLNFISRKGCWKSAFELSKVVLGLDYEHDPMAMLLLVDFYALKAPGGLEWLVRAWDEWKVSKSLRLLPNWMYSIALAKFLRLQEGSIKDEAKMDECVKLLHVAMAYFPSLLLQLLDKTGAGVDSRLLAYPIFQEDSAYVNTSH